jgi:hypothetical protein
MAIRSVLGGATPSIVAGYDDASLGSWFKSRLDLDSSSHSPNKKTARRRSLFKAKPFRLAGRAIGTAVWRRNGAEESGKQVLQKILTPP